MLIVGKGGTGNLSGGGSGMVAFLKNYSPSSSFGYFNRLNAIQFDTNYDGIVGTRVSIDRSINNNGNITQNENEIVVGNGQSPNGSIYVKYYQNIKTSKQDITSSLNGYGSNGGGGNSDNTYASGGGGGSNGMGQDYSVGTFLLPGGTGGNGPFGQRGGKGKTAENSIVGGPGIVCLYYHNVEI